MSIEQESISQATDDQAFGEINFFSPSSRINRLRYWAHSMLMIIPFYVVAGIGAFLAFKVSPIFWGLVGIAYIAMIVFSFILIIQRLHDLDKSGWLSLLILVPFANLYLMVLLIFFAGTPGRNSYGLQTPPNKTWHWILALGFPVLFFVLGIVAAIALPAYQQYVMKGQQEQIQSFETTDPEAVESDEAGSEATEGNVIEDEAVEGDVPAEEEGQDSSEHNSEKGSEQGSENGAVVEEKVAYPSADQPPETPKAPENN